MVTGLRNTDYLLTIFDDKYDMSNRTGLSESICGRIIHNQSFQMLTIHYQAMAMAGVNLNEYLQVKINV